MAWPPTAAEFYLDLNGRERPHFQGDVYREVPFTKTKGSPTATADPATSSDRRTVATLSHPCDMYGEGGTLRRPQAIVLVRKESGDGLPADWKGCLHLCPLPDLFGDGETWVADFTLVGNADRGHLKLDRRVRVLSELGWAVFRQRAATAMSRALVKIPDMITVGATTWHESMMEMDWLEAGKTSASFADWLDARDDERCADFESRRAALDTAKGRELVQQILTAELAAMGTPPAVSTAPVQPAQ